MKSIPDDFVLHHNSLDGYLFLRFFKLLIFICLVGCCITWPVLFPVNATGGGGQSQLDILSISNVKDPVRYYAHALVAWVFLGFVILAVAHERMFFVGARQAYFLSPLRAKRLTSRTILFMSLPKEYQSEHSLRELLGRSVRKVWMVTDCEDLEEAVQDRTKAATKLEGGETKLITAAEKDMHKKEGKEKFEPQHYLDGPDRPTHRLKFLIGKKVDTINWARDEIPKLSKDIKQQQDQKMKGNDPVSAAFVEFDSQLSAQKALQLAVPSKKNYKPRFIDVQPEEIIWKNLKKSYAARKAMFAVGTAVIILMTLFWTPITAFVGALANINSLTNKVPFLSFINDVPKVILGVITGLLPTIVLAVCIILVPIICRLVAKLAGAVTLSEVELKTQSWYFIFQVIQVFLITTFASGAAAVVTKIIENPSSAPTLLATNLPKASNFYMSYFILYGLLQAALQLLLIVPLLMKTLLGKFLDKTPRKQYTRYTTLAGLGWGSEYPKWTNLGVIALAYSCIAPLLLAFATIGFGLLYIAFRHNWLFVLGNQIDMKGEAYSRALQQLTTGVYLSTICLIGLFAIGTSGSNSGIGPLVLMVVFLILVIIFQILLNRAIGPLEQALPLDMLATNPASRWIGGADGDAHSDPLQVPLKNGNGEMTSTPHHEKDDVVAEDNFLTKRIRPIIHNRFFSPLNSSAPVVDSDAKVQDDIPDDGTAYFNPSITSPEPLIWLPRDGTGLGKLLIRGNEEKQIKTTDEYAWLDEKQKVVWDTSRAEDVDEMLSRWRTKQDGQGQGGRQDYATVGGQGGGSGEVPGDGA